MFECLELSDCGKNPHGESTAIPKISWYGSSPEHQVDAPESSSTVQLFRVQKVSFRHEDPCFHLAVLSYLTSNKKRHPSETSNLTSR
jgi:hypothetical protein